MPAYIHGNLAVEQKTKTGQKVSVKETKKIYRHKTLPVQEKLFYLFTLLICVVVASLIIWRYAQIYEMNTKILDMETKIQMLQAENSTLKRKVDTLSAPDRLRDEAIKLGMVPPEDKQISKVPSKSASTGSSVASAGSNHADTP